MVGETVHPCRVCGRLLAATDPVVDFVELIDGGVTMDGQHHVLEGLHDFAHARCWPRGAKVPGAREKVRDETLAERLRALGGV